MRLTAALSLIFTRRGEIDHLFEVTAHAFGQRPPYSAKRGTRGRLDQLARYTAECAARVTTLSAERSAVERRLFQEACQLGTDFRRRLKLRSLSDALRALRLIYRGLGIDLRPRLDGTVRVYRCRFAAAYTGEICRVVSSLDRGLFAGITGGRDLRFRLRMTEGAPVCEASFSGCSR